MNYPAHDPHNAVVCFDFDGVIAKTTWPSPALGKPNHPEKPGDPDPFKAMRHYFEQGCEIIVCTARPDEHLPRIRTWIRKHGLDDVVYEVCNRKPVACLYFDDRAVRWPL